MCCMENPLLTTKEVADELKVSERWVTKEMQDNPRDVWDEQGIWGAKIMMYLMFDKFIVDTLLEHLPTDALRKQYTRYLQDFTQGKKPIEEVNAFLERYIPNLTGVYNEIERDFYNGAYEDYEPQRIGNRMEIVRVR